MIKFISAVAFTCLVNTCVSAQEDNLIFTKKNFQDVLVTAKEAEFIGNTAYVNFKSNKYEGLYNIWGNLYKINKDIPIGDFTIVYNYIVKSGSDNSCLGMSYVTEDLTSGEHFMFSYMLSPSGELKCYSSKAKSYYTPVPEKEFISEVCEAIKPLSQQNSVAVQRKGRQWTLMINSVIVKQFTEPPYGSDVTKGAAAAPLVKNASNILLAKGKQELEFSNCSQSFYAQMQNFGQDIEALSSVEGNYKLSPHCRAGSSDYIFDVQVKYSREDFNHKVTVSGMTDQAKIFYLVKDDIIGAWSANLGREDILINKNRAFSIDKILFYPLSKKMVLQIRRNSYSNSTEYIFDCNFEGYRI